MEPSTMKVDNSMSDPITPVVGTKYVIVTYVLPLLSITAGAVAHVLEEIRIQGWRGWVSALSSGFVAFFAGTMVFTFALAFYPNFAGGLAGLAGFFGPKSISILVKALKSTVKEL